MTRAAHEPTAPDLAAALRGSGYRLTPQRQLILGAVQELGHATPEEVLAQVRHQASAINASTVYRTLEVLEELGLVRHTHLTDRAPTYHSAAEPEHVHLVCRSCRDVTSIAPTAVAAMIELLRHEHGFRVDVGHLSVFGECARCADQSDRTSMGPEGSEGEGTS